MSRRFDFVYFDLDDTLLDHRSAERQALAALHAELGAEKALPIDPQTLQREYHESNVVLWRRYSLAEITADELRHDRFAVIVQRHGLDADPMELSDRYMDLYSRFWSPISGAIETFRQIARTTPVGIITNGFAATQRKKLDRFDELRDLSASIVISEEFGHMKPSARLFDHALQMAGCSAERVLYVGDSWHSDVEGGLASGWNVAWYRSRNETRMPEGEWADRFVSFAEWDELVEHCGGE